MCSGRVDLEFILRAFSNGQDGVFIGGCKLDECNYVTHGNYDALANTYITKRILEHIGLNPERLRIEFMTGADGKGAMTLWPLFGTANQLLASLALLVVTFYLKHKGGMKFIITAVPCIIMLFITTWAMIQNQIRFIADGKWHLVVIGVGIMVLALWMIIEALITFRTAGTKQ